MAKLYFRYGTVGSAKTLNLIAVAHNYVQQGKAVVIAKPSLDTRFGRERVASRAALSKQATVIIDDDTILTPEHFKNIHCLVVDEVQFLHPKHIETFRKIADVGCPVICYGLRTDFRRHLFPGSQRLLELADTIEEVKTTCYYCNRKAIFNLKLVNGQGTLSGAQVELGCEELYLPTCSNHFAEKTDHCPENRPPAAKTDNDNDATKSDVETAISEAETKDSKLSSKTIVPPTDIAALTKHSQELIYKLKCAFAIDNDQDPAAVQHDYVDPLEQQ